jgi:hypothetical protein
MNNYYHHQNPPVRQQRRDPRYYGHPEEVELSIIRKSNAANYIKIYCLSTELDEFLINKGLIQRCRHYDFQDHLDILRFQLQRDPYFLPSDPNFRPYPYSEIELKDVVDGRNDYDHNNWDAVLVHTNKHLKAMMDLADALNQRRVANEIFEIRNAISAGDFSGGVTFKPFRFPVSRSYDELAGLGMNQISTAVMSGKMAKRLYRYIRTSLPMGSPPPSIDIYANSLDIIDIINEHDPNYLGRNGLHVILKLKEFRLDLVHGRYEKTLREFKEQYDNLERLLRVMGDKQAADEVAAIRDLLLEFQRSGKEVKPSFFPGLFN